MPQPDCSPSAERNKQPLLEVLRSVLPARGEALEIASGTGQHVAWFAQHLPQWNWQPTDLHRGALYNIEAYTDQAELTNVYAPRQLNVMDTHWLPEGETVDLVLCINMLHIAPWDACAALMQGSARHLPPQGKLVTYGPYFEDGVPPADSNLAPPTLVPYAALSGSLDFANKSGALGKVGLGFGNSYGQCVSNTDVGTVAANKLAPILKPVCGPLNLDCAALEGPAAEHANAQLANQFPLLGLMPCACAAATSKLGVQKIADTLKAARECGATLAEVGKVLGDAAQGTYALGGQATQAASDAATKAAQELGKAVSTATGALGTAYCAVAGVLGACSKSPPPTAYAVASSWCKARGGLAAFNSLTNQPNDFNMACNDGTQCRVLGARTTIQEHLQRPVPRPQLQGGHFHFGG